MARKKKTDPAQMSLLELSLKTAPCVPAIRQEVRDWAADGYKGATHTTKTLLNYWFRTDHRLPNGDKFQYYHFQRESIETLIYLYEVAQKRRHKDLIETYAQASPPPIPPIGGEEGGEKGGAAAAAIRRLSPLLHQNGDRQIDALVYELYGLSEEEIEIVEQTP